MTHRSWPTLTLILATLVVGMPASILSADAVDPPPATCPPGSRPTSSHAGPLCAPEAECTTSTSCGAGASCMTVMQCVEQRPCGGLRPPDSGSCFVSNVLGPCRSDGSCATGTCTTRSVCSTGSTSGCACSVAGSRSTQPTNGAMSLAILALLSVAARRRSVGGPALFERKRREAIQQP